MRIAVDVILPSLLMYLPVVAKELKKRDCSDVLVLLPESLRVGGFSPWRVCLSTLSDIFSLPLSMYRHW